MSESAVCSGDIITVRGGETFTVVLYLGQKITIATPAHYPLYADEPLIINLNKLPKYKTPTWKIEQRNKSMSPVRKRT